VLYRFELTNRSLVSITTDNAFSNYSMASDSLHSSLEASGIQWPAFSNYILCMRQVIQLAFGALMSSLRGVKGHPKSWAAHEGDQQFGENDSIDIGNSQRLLRQGNDRTNKVSTMRPGLLKIIEKVFFFIIYRKS
jgi:hypothetical protein